MKRQISSLTKFRQQISKFNTKWTRSSNGTRNFQLINTNEYLLRTHKIHRTISITNSTYFDEQSFRPPCLPQKTSLPVTAYNFITNSKFLVKDSSVIFSLHFVGKISQIWRNIVKVNTHSSTPNPILEQENIKWFCCLNCSEQWRLFIVQPMGVYPKWFFCSKYCRSSKKKRTI